MGKLISVTASPPLCVRSKLLCFSLVYLLTTLSLFLYVSLSRNQCIFRYSPFDPIQTKMFSFPSSYGEHKYALPTHRSSCSSPVFFSGTYLPICDFSLSSGSYIMGYCRVMIWILYLLFGVNKITGQY